MLAVLHAENVLARRYFYPGCHRMEPYGSEEPGVCERLPVTARVKVDLDVVVAHQALNVLEPLRVIFTRIRMAVGAIEVGVHRPSEGVRFDVE